MPYNYPGYPNYSAPTYKDPSRQVNPFLPATQTQPAPTTPPTNPFTAGASGSVKNYFDTPNSGSWGWNAGNPVNMQRTPMPSTGMSAFEPASTSGGMVRNPAPATGVSSVDFGGSQDVMTALPGFGGARTMNTQTGDAFMGGTQVASGPGLQNQNFETPMPQFNQPGPTPGFTAPGFQTQYGTLGNIQDYMTPYLDQIISRGNKNIMANASARGLLGSTGTEDRLGEWGAQAQSEALNDAFNRFAADRGYMTDVYKDSRNFDYGNYRDTNAWDYGLYSDERKDWNQRMADWYKQMGGIVDTGAGAAGNAADIQTDLGRALAILYGNRGDVGANQAANAGAANAGGIDALLGLLSMFGGK
jgi:hypothetical protein